MVGRLLRGTPGIQARRPPMRLTVVVSSRAHLALSERLDLLGEAADVDEIVAESDPWQATRRLARHSRSLPYLLDVNRLTAAVAGRLATARRPFVLDTGDDPASLGRSMGGRFNGTIQGAVERAVLWKAGAVVCRGSFHLPVLRRKTAAPLWWAPDTVPDALLDRPLVAGDPGVVATFGSAPAPRASDRAYGWEVVDVVAAVSGLRGVIVVRGPGAEALRARARRMGVADRVTVEPPLPLVGLAVRLDGAASLTSVQTDDRAGWVRTTGKLPIALGLGKLLVTTRVGEASRVLPQSCLVEPGDDEAVVAAMAAVVAAGPPPGWPVRARATAEQFRRSTVAAGLGGFLSGLGL